MINGMAVVPDSSCQIMVTSKKAPYLMIRSKDDGRKRIVDNRGKKRELVYVIRVEKQKLNFNPP